MFRLHAGTRLHAPGEETSEKEAHQQLDRFVETGGTLVDTANVYSTGVSEEIIGRWFASRPTDVREHVVLATKVRAPRITEVTVVRSMSQASATCALEQLEHNLGAQGLSFP